MHIFEAKWRLLCLFPSNIFTQWPHFGRPFLKAFKRRSYSVGTQNFVSLIKMFSSIHFNNLVGMKTKRANVNRKVRKLGNITLGISPDIPQFWLHHVMCFDQSRARKKYLMDYNSSYGPFRHKLKRTFLWLIDNISVIKMEHEHLSSHRTSHVFKHFQNSESCRASNSADYFKV